MTGATDDGRLFDPPRPVAAPDTPNDARPAGRIVRVLPDVGAIRREFDYVVPTRWADAIEIGTMVRVVLNGRRVAGWITALDVEPLAGVRLATVTKVSGVGPSAEIVELCRWAAWRWAGKTATFLGSASPPSMVRVVPPRRHPPGGDNGLDAIAVEPWIEGAFDEPRVTLRLAPTHDPFDVVVAAVRRGDALVVCPSLAQAATIARRLRAGGVDVALYPDEWARAAAGATVVGARAAVLAPMAAAAAIVVIDEHDEALQNEGSPTWHARELALARGRRLGVPVVLTSPCPTLEAQKVTPIVAPPRSLERAGWPLVEIVDRRSDDMGRTGLYSEALVRALRGEGRMVCVLNRVGRSRLSACHRCGTLAACERCAAYVVQGADAVLECPRCGQRRPVVCSECGSNQLRHLRIGVTKAREELETLLREPVGEVTGATRGHKLPSARVLIGTEAVLHQVDRAAIVAFLEFDQELTAPRYRGAEEALTLLVRAGRLVGGRREGTGRVIVQTRVAEHEVLEAAVAADPTMLSGPEQTRRALTEMPPASTVAVVGGPSADAFVESFRAIAGVRLDDLRVDAAGEHQWLIRSANRTALLDVLDEVPRPAGRLRLQIDPLRLPHR